jgi:excisionase family DNA binding protein
MTKDLMTLTLTVPQLVERTGVSRTKVYAEIASGRLRSFRLGRRRLFKVSDVESWLDSYR